LNFIACIENKFLLYVLQRCQTAALHQSPNVLSDALYVVRWCQFCYD